MAMQQSTAALDDFRAAMDAAELALADLSERIPRVGASLPGAVEVFVRVIQMAKFRSPSEEGLALARCASRAALAELRSMADAFEDTGASIDQLLIAAGRARAAVGE